MEDLSQGLNDSNLDFNQLFSDGVHICLEILIQKDLMRRELSTPVSRDAIEIGHQMSILITQYFENLTPVEDDELYLADEEFDSLVIDLNLDTDGHNDESDKFTETPESPIVLHADSQESNQTSSQESETSTELSSISATKKFKSDPISLQLKIKMVAIADAHPNWGLSTLQRNGCAALTRMDTLIRWRADIAKNGTQFDRSDYIHEKTFESFKEARSRRQPVLFRNCQEWALQADFEYDAEVHSLNPNSGNDTGNESEADTNNRKKFYASKTWITRFKARYRIK
ncbi:hypothetical protein QAD02_011726 [Eretmocerus hayati]|uniref:Uncharacterized protein n=1 Tax=Eretmocerus hayati TaxID=131215 RepID=A0ACC2NXB1_9HYME|nr:hypothetical protein QAD02_011726 [Eretmocerus hayati]